MKTERIEMYRMNVLKTEKTNLLVVGLSLIVIGILLLLPTGFEGALQFTDAVKCKAKIVSVDNSRIVDTGLIRSGQQVCTVRLLSGKFTNQTTDAWNMLSGSLETDKLFAVNDVAQCFLHYDGAEIISVNLIDHYRLSGELILAIAFALFLIIFARGVGFRAVISFVLTILVIWKLLVPLYLKGVDPVLAGLLIIAILTFFILALVYGFNKKLLSSFCGALLGILLTAILSIFCTKSFKIHGAVMAYSESLLYSGFQDLNLTPFL